MRVRIVLGAVLILAGGYILARGLSYTSKENVVDLGGLHISAEERQPVPTWAGGLLAIAGLVLVVSGAANQRVDLSGEVAIRPVLEFPSHHGMPALAGDRRLPSASCNAPQPACTMRCPDSAAFDFWVGEWEVTDTTGHVSRQARLRVPGRRLCHHRALATARWLS